MTGLRIAVSVVFVAAVPLLIISSTLRWLVTDRAFIVGGFRENQVTQTTGLDGAQLERIADSFIAYFQAPPGRMDLQVQVGGATRPLFNEREIVHMEDVQALVQLFLGMQAVAGAVVLVRIGAAVWPDRSGQLLGRDLLLSGALMVVLVGLVGILAMSDFSALWTQFHRIAFRNDFWQLDPARDYLILLFPQPFWFAGTMRMAGGVAAGTLLATLIGAALLRFSPPPA